MEVINILFMVLFGLNVVTWNLTGIMSSAMHLSEVLNEGNIDICGLSEHWLSKSNVHFIDSVCADFNHVTVCSNNGCRNRNIGKGGVSIMWRKKYDNLITPLNIDDDRIVGIQLQVSPGQYMFFFQVYLPCSNYSIDMYNDYMYKLYDLFFTYYDQGFPIFMGDFNANPQKEKLLGRDKSLSEFVNTCNIVATNMLPICEGPTHTFVSYDDSCVSCIDYIFVPCEYVDFVTYCEVADDSCLNVSRHRPILCCFDIDISNLSHMYVPECSIRWKYVQSEQLMAYCELLSESVNAIDTHDCDVFYTTLCDVIHECARRVIPVKTYRRHLKPYWVTELSDAHQRMKASRTLWCRAGRPRGQQFPEYVQYKTAKQSFRHEHRRCANSYLTDLDNKLENDAVEDTVSFWRSVNARKKSNCVKVGDGIQFDGKMFRSREDIVTQWGQYFKNLYTPLVSTVNDEWDYTVNRTVEQAFRSMTLDPDVSVPPEQVVSCVKTLTKGKASGPDKVSHEHLIYGINALAIPLSNLYTRMLTTGIIPTKLKEGEIITLYKGGRKRKDDPNSYRAITLSSSILKVYEIILLERCRDNILKTLHKLQCGFQEKLGCMMTSFALRESLFFAKENSSSVYLCFLDARQAFDRVWHSGLFFKLLHMNVSSGSDTPFNYSTRPIPAVDNNTLMSLKDMYNDVRSRVRYQGLLSDSFPVLQGTRQGGKTSPLLYLVYIDGLIKELCTSGNGLCIHDINLSCPTVADDMVLMSHSRNGLNNMLQICERYAKKWKFLYNANKCAVLEFNTRTTSIPEEKFTYLLGNERLPICDKYTHLGIICDSTASANDNIKNACVKLRSTYFDLCNNGLSPRRLSASTLMTIYNSAIIPKALYGNDLWTNYSQSDILSLERAHRLCIKSIQGYKRSTATDFSLATSNSIPIETMIECNKLKFFGQLCRLKTNYITKHIFNNRLVRYMNNDNLMQGFIPDVTKIFQKYTLCDYMVDYLQTGLFPSNTAWKKIINEKVINRTKTDINIRLRQIDPLNVTENVIEEGYLSPLWQIVKRNPQQRTQCSTLMDSIGQFISRQYEQQCRLCELRTDNIVVHNICFCPATDHLRNNMWSSCCQLLGFNVFMDLARMDALNQTATMLKFASCIENGNFKYNRLSRDVASLLKHRKPVTM